MRFGIKMMLGFIILLALSFGAGGSILISASFSNSLERSTDTAVATHRLAMYTLAAVSSGARDEYVELKSTLTQIDAPGASGWVSLRLSDGKKVIFQSQYAAEYYDTLSESADGEHYATRIYRSVSGKYLLQIAGQFGTESGVMRFESIFDLSSVYSARGEQQATYRRLFIVVTGLGALLSWGLSYWLTAPLRKLSRVTRSIASGDLSCRAEVSAKDEIGVLASDFNNMTGLLEANILELRDTMRRQEEFMGGFAHELKTPMTSIIGYADLLRSHALTDNDRREAANYIFSEGKRLEVLSLKLLDLIVLKRRDFTLIPGSVLRIAEQVRRLMRPVLSSQNIRLGLRCDNEQCMMEPDLIKSLLINIIDNARKAIDGAGEIVVESEAIPGGCIIRVTDNGRGMDEQALSKITDAFYRIDKSRSRAQGGVGLGLTLCREIALLHGGDIAFESVLGKGTRVTVTLKGGKAE